MTPKINTHNLLVDFGKHKGERWTRVPIGYLKWLINEDSQYKDIATAELQRRGIKLDEYTVEISGHAVDRASLRCWRHYHKTRLNSEEGLYAWLMRIATEGLARNEEGTTVVHYNGLKLVFVYGEVYPTLTTVARDVRPTPVKKRSKKQKHLQTKDKENYEQFFN